LFCKPRCPRSHNQCRCGLFIHIVYIHQIINSLLGQIPILGTILTGEKGGGIFAASYKVRGPVEKPEMSVNPLSALAPGFLRNLLSGTGNGASDGGTPDQEERLRQNDTLPAAPAQ